MGDEQPSNGIKKQVSIIDLNCMPIFDFPTAAHAHAHAAGRIFANIPHSRKTRTGTDFFEILSPPNLINALTRI